MDIDPEDPLIPIWSHRRKVNDGHRSGRSPNSQVDVRRRDEDRTAAMNEQKQKQTVHREGSEQSTIPSPAPGPRYLREHQEVPTLGPCAFSALRLRPPPLLLDWTQAVKRR